MFKILSFVILSCVIIPAFAQTAGTGAVNIERPKIVIGIVVDQMRWDYLYRYYERYRADGGFKRLLNDGFSCSNTLIPYVPTVTACGHSSIYTGSVPAINGITGNEWWDYHLGQSVYCTADANERSVGGTGTAGQMSPRNLLVTTIGDELHLAANFHNKVIGIALKDRGAILPAGHTANAAYWFEEATGNWISSSYYLNNLPKWVDDLNAQKLADKYYAGGWNTLYPLDTYIASTPDNEPYEHHPFGNGSKGFPYKLEQFAGKNYNIVHVTPFGNTYTLDMAEAAINGEQLGTGTNTDMLTISLSTPDYIGHTFGPNSIEAEDDFLRLDKDLGSFLDFLDTKLGKGHYLLFLTADHGAAHVPSFLNQHRIPAGNAVDTGYMTTLNSILKTKYGHPDLVIGVFNYQVWLDRKLIKQFGLNRDDIYASIIDYLTTQPGVYRAFALDGLSAVTLNATIKTDVTNGYFPQRSGDIQILFKPQWIENFEGGGTTHGEWNPYDAHIPLLWYGWHISRGSTGREIYITDIAPTIAGMLHIQMPSGSIGHVIDDVYK